MSAANGSGEKEQWLKKCMEGKMRIQAIGILGETKFVPSEPGMGPPIPSYFWIDLDDAFLQKL
ncbi:MAG: hypothetical protein ACYC67_27630 [Prosthecobacter sp.]